MSRDNGGMSDTVLGARTLERGLVLVELVAAEPGRLDDLARRAELSRSTAHRLLASLTAAGYLRHGADRVYRLGPSLLRLGSIAERDVDLPAEISAILRHAADDLGDAVHLGVLSGTEVVYVAKAAGRRGVEMRSRPGARFAAQNTAMGKVLLGSVPTSALAELFDADARATDASVSTVGELVDAVADAKANGYAIESDENELGISCLAIGLNDGAGSLLAALSVSMPTPRLTQDRIPRLRATLEQARRALELVLPGSLGDQFTPEPPIR